MGDKFDMSGDFRGAILNIKSKLSHVSQSIQTTSGFDDDVKVQLNELVARLIEQLEKVPEEKADDAEAVATLTQDLVDTANKDAPNRRVLEIKGESLKKAAENLASVTPAIVMIVREIISNVLQGIR